jgi:hypothetical protein
MLKKKLGGLVYTYNPSTQTLKQGDCQLEASLVYMADSRPAWAMCETLPKKKC